MAVNPMSAINAYAAAANAAGGAGQGSSLLSGLGGSGASDPLSGFASLLENSIGAAEAQLGHAETMSAQAAVGQAELVDVVTAIAAAETSLETMLAVRDEVIRAYQDILKMPI